MIELLVGLKVTEDTMYSDYRKAMMPILNKMGGGFRYDFQVSTVLKAESNHDINRLFIIYFPDRITMEKFFTDKAYLEIKDKYFCHSVETTTVIATYERLQ